MSEIEPLTVGSTLKKRREELGLTLAAMAEKTRIRSTFLQAMEEDRFDGFPGDAYLHGFLKLFAEALELDASMVMAQFREQAGIPGGGLERKSTVHELSAVAPRRKSRSFGAILLALVLGVTLGAACFILYSWPFSDDPRLMDPRQLSPVSGDFSLSAGSVVPLVVEADADKAPPESPVATPDATVSAEQQESDDVIPFGGGMLRVEALGAVNVEALIDDLPLKRYALAKDTVLSWRVLNSLQLQVDAPERLNVWLENEPLELQGRSQLSLRAAMPAAEEGRR